VTAQTLQSPPGGATRELARTAELIAAIDAAVREFAGRELVAGAEVVDLLLDLRLTAEAHADVSEGTPHP
jgi:hypothetical protein